MAYSNSYHAVVLLRFSRAHLLSLLHVQHVFSKEKTVMYTVGRSFYEGYKYRGNIFRVSLISFAKIGIQSVAETIAADGI